MTTPDTKTTIERCHKAALALGMRLPHLLLIHARMRARYRVTHDVSTFAVTSDGWLYVNPDFCATLSHVELQGVIAHEILHPTMDHFARAKAMGLITSEDKPAPGRDQDLETWNYATDMAINTSLQKDGIELPSGALYAPPDYTGPLFAEAIYEWLKKKQQQSSKRSGQGQGQGGKKEQNSTRGTKSVAGGCGMLPPEQGKKGQAQQDQQNKQGQGSQPQQGPQGDQGQGAEQGAGQSDPVDWIQIGRECVAMARAIGRGSSALVTLLEHRDPRIDWKRVLKRGLQVAEQARGLDRATYSKISRRGREGVITPGYFATRPSVAIVIDVSSSMSREWVKQIVSECEAIGKSQQGAKIYLVSHTARVTWQGWIRAGSDTGKISDSVQFQGGTDANAAYEAVSKAGRFDVLIHFTDCELGNWPKVPARKLVVGAFGSGATEPYCQPPPHTELIPCMVE